MDRSDEFEVAAHVDDALSVIPGVAPSIVVLVNSEAKGCTSTVDEVVSAEKPPDFQALGMLVAELIEDLVFPLSWKIVEANILFPVGKVRTPIKNAHGVGLPGRDYDSRFATLDRAIAYLDALAKAPLAITVARVESHRLCRLLCGEVGADVAAFSEAGDVALVRPAVDALVYGAVDEVTD